MSIKLEDQENPRDKVKDMDAVWWIIVIAVLAPVAWFVFKAVVGASVNPEVSGKHFLRQRLQQMEVDAKLIPEACLEEIVRNSMGVAEMMKFGNRESIRTNLVKSLDAAAVNIYLIMNEGRNEERYYLDILRKYGVVK